jgi:hypothetical protein
MQKTGNRNPTLQQAAAPKNAYSWQPVPPEKYEEMEFENEGSDNDLDSEKEYDGV